jgi:hypothetical protein
VRRSVPFVVLRRCPEVVAADHEGHDVGAQHREQLREAFTQIGGVETREPEIDDLERNGVLAGVPERLEHGGIGFLLLYIEPERVRVAEREKPSRAGDLPADDRLAAGEPHHGRTSLQGELDQDESRDDAPDHQPDSAERSMATAIGSPTVVCGSLRHRAARTARCGACSKSRDHTLVTFR